MSRLGVNLGSCFHAEPTLAFKRRNSEVPPWHCRRVDALVVFAAVFFSGVAPAGEPLSMPSGLQTSDSRQLEDDKSDEDKSVETESEDDKELSTKELSAKDRAQQAEIKRRLDSLAKSVEKEDRPDKPEFSGANRIRAGGAITFDDLKFDMEKGDRFDRSLLTDSINELAGKRLKLKGYIRPSIRQKGLTKFIFVRDDKECCFGPGAALYDCVLVTLSKGEKSDYIPRPITVEGDFFLKEYTGPNGKVWAIYRMRNGQIK